MPITMGRIAVSLRKTSVLRPFVLTVAAVAGGLAGATWPRAAPLGRWLYWAPQRFPDDAGPASSLWPRFGGLSWAGIAAVLLFVLWRECRASGRREPGAGAAALLGSAAWFAAIGALVVLLADVLGQMAERAGFPLDLLLWSEGPFLQDMLKLHRGWCPYSPADQNNSFVYNPGAPLFTWAVSSLCGRYGDLAFSRTLQIGCALLACAVAWVASRLLARAEPDEAGEPGSLSLPSSAAWALGLFVLAAGLNPVTSPFVDLLHTDALAMLTGACGLLALAARGRVGPRLWLLLAVPLPMLAVLVKQTGTVVWLGLVLGVWLQDRRPWAALRFALLSGGLVGALALGLTLWSHGWWTYWTARVLADQPMIWESGVAMNGWALSSLAPLAVVAAVWFIGGRRLASAERGRAFTSVLLYTGLLGGSAAVTTFKHGTCGANHWGTAALGLTVLATAATARFLLSARDRRWDLVAAAGVLIALGLLHRTARPLPEPDDYRIAAELRRTFAETDPARTLLDHGTLPYLDANVVPLDRCNSVLESSVGGVRQIDATTDRILQQKYHRILIHGDLGLSWYNTVANAVLTSYDLKARLTGSRRRSVVSFLLGDVFVYEPKPSEVRRHQPAFVISTEPGIGVPTGHIPADIRVRFSRPMDPATVNPESVSLLRRAERAGHRAEPVPASRFHYDPITRTATVTPRDPLKTGRYWIVVTDAARDLEGRSVWPGSSSGWIHLQRLWLRNDVNRGQDTALRAQPDGSRTLWR